MLALVGEMWHCRNDRYYYYHYALGLFQTFTRESKRALLDLVMSRPLMALISDIQVRQSVCVRMGVVVGVCGYTGLDLVDVGGIPEEAGVEF